MIERGVRPALGIMTHIASLAGRNMTGSLTLSNSAVMATLTGSNSLGMINGDYRRPRRITWRMAGITLIG